MMILWTFLLIKKRDQPKVSKSVFGDSMGTVASGSKAKMSYDVELDSKWNVENLYMYALIISEKTGYIHNMAYCKAINGFMDSEE